MQIVCTFCGELRAIDEIAVHGPHRVCAPCVWNLVEQLEARGAARPGSQTAPLAAPCSLCETSGTGTLVIGDVRVCATCARAVAHLVLNSPRDHLEEIWGIELAENTRMRKVTEAVAVELRQGAHTHAQLATELANAGELGQALIEAAIAIVTDPADKQAVEVALRVLLGARAFEREHGMAVTTPLSLVASLKEHLGNRT